MLHRGFVQGGEGWLQASARNPEIAAAGTGWRRRPSPAQARGAFSLSDEAVEQSLLEATDAGLLEDYFGPAQHAELQRLAQQANRRSVRGGPRVLILPGIMGSKLGHDDGWPFDDVIWIDPVDVARGRLERLALPQKGKAIRPLGVLLFAYLALKYRLRQAGFDADFHPFDWRQSQEQLGRELAERIDAEGPTVHLVAHSMGGLVARGALAANPKKLGRIVMLGTPNHGSFSPVQAFRGTHSIVRKVDFLDPFHSSEELARDVFGTFPGLLEMIPRPEMFGIDLFETAAWPESGVHPQQAMLRRAREVQAALPAAHDDLYLVVGVDQKTVISADVQDGEFVYRVSTDGDGTVPRISAMIEGARRTFYIADEHGALPNNRKLAEAVGSILATGTTDLLPDRYEPQRAPASALSERSLNVPPYTGLPTRALSMREQRRIVEEFAAPDRTASLAGTDATAPASESTPSTTFSDRVVVGRARQHRLEINLAHGSISQVDAQAYVMGIFQHVAPGGAARELDRLMGGAIGRMVERRMFNAGVGEISMVPTGRHPVRADVVAFAGLGAYDTFQELTLEVVGENLVRTFAATRVDEFALVPLGGGSGRFTLAALERLLTGFLRGLRDADPDGRFRGITICEMDRDRYVSIRDEIYRLSATELFEDVEVTLRESKLPATPATPSRAPSELPSAGFVYLMVRQESGEDEQDVVFRASVLTTGAKAAIQMERTEFRRKALDDLLGQLHKMDTPEELSAFGGDLAELILPQSTRKILRAYADHPLVVVHDAGASRVPWETLRLDTVFPAARGGMSHRYEAENLSVAKWLEQRRLGPTLDILLVINPTGDLDGAEEEGRRVLQILEGMRPAVRVRELRGTAARRQELLNCFSSGQYDVVHYAGHAFFDEDDPARSGLVCAYDEILTGADIAALGSLPSLVFFNACEAARVRKSRKGAARTRSPGLSVRDRVQRTVGFAEAFPAGRHRQLHRHLLAGRRRRRQGVRRGVLRAAGHRQQPAPCHAVGPWSRPRDRLGRLGRLLALRRSGLCPEGRARGWRPGSRARGAGGGRWPGRPRQA